jgi:hypothetical protein
LRNSSGTVDPTDREALYSSPPNEGGDGPLQWLLWTDASSGHRHLDSDHIGGNLDVYLREVVEGLMGAIELHEQIIGFSILIGLPVLAFLASIFWYIVWGGHDGN